MQSVPERSGQYVPAVARNGRRVDTGRRCVEQRFGDLLCIELVDGDQAIRMTGIIEQPLDLTAQSVVDRHEGCVRHQREDRSMEPHRQRGPGAAHCVKASIGASMSIVE